MTAEEMAIIREYHNERARRWWAAMSPDERRERRHKYALRAAINKANREQEEKVK